MLRNLASKSRKVTASAGLMIRGQAAAESSIGDLSTIRMSTVIDVLSAELFLPFAHLAGPQSFELLVSRLENVDDL